MLELFDGLFAGFVVALVMRAAANSSPAAVFIGMAVTGVAWAGLTVLDKRHGRVGVWQRFGWWWYRRRLKPIAAWRGEAEGIGQEVGAQEH